MIKTIEAFFRGYVKFRVVTKDNERFYWSYSKAQAARTLIKTGPLHFDGYHIFKGWVCFYQRIDIK